MFKNELPISNSQLPNQLCVWNWELEVGNWELQVRLKPDTTSLFARAFAGVRSTAASTATAATSGAGGWRTWRAAGNGL